MNGLEAKIRRAYDATRPVELADVHRALRARRRRRRILATTAAVGVVVAASVAALARAEGGSSRVHVTVSGPTPPTSGRTSKPDASSTAEHSIATQGGITVRFVFYTPTVRVGGTLRGRLVVTTRKVIHGCPPGGSFPLSVSSARTGQQAPVSSLPLCPSRLIAIDAGTTSYAIKATATYQTCSGTRKQANSDRPYCGPGNKGMPNLPAGRYELAPAVGLGDLLPQLPTPPAVTLTITAPPKPATTGTTVVGTLEAVGGAAPGKPRPLSGTVTLHGPDTYAMRVSANGQFRVEVAPGRYTLTGRSPAYQGGSAACRDADTITALRHETTNANVLCQEK